MPLGFWAQEAFAGRATTTTVSALRQGFVPALLARELLRRRTAALPGRLLFFLVPWLLAFSAFLRAHRVVDGGGVRRRGEAFLRKQGDGLATQWDGS